MGQPTRIDEQVLADRIDRFQIETPSWGYADTGTRFGKFLQEGAATTIDEKLADAGQVHAFTGCCPSVALHALWDLPDGTDLGSVKELSESHGLRIGAMNPNVFEEQCYKLGSVTNEDAAIRRQAIDHVIACIDQGHQLGSPTLSLWFADGTNYPGQGHIRRRKAWTADSLREVHAALPDAMAMFIEYKPFEPAFYHTDIADWGMAYALAKQAGARAKVLVDTGHHLPGANVEHIVAFLIDEGMLGGFHFNDRKYADDDLTMGSIDPYQLFRIFFEIASAEREAGHDLDIKYMVDQSHNLKPKIEAMIQTVMVAQEQFAKAFLVDQDALDRARRGGDIVAAEATLRDAFAIDVRPFLSEFRCSRGLPEDPLAAFRQSGYVEQAARRREANKKTRRSSYA